MISATHRALLLLSIFALTTPILASAADPSKGQKVFKKCKACHTVGENAKNKVGPHLNGIAGRVAGSVDGYKYSKAMKSKGAENLIWDNNALAAYLSAPKKFVPGTKMSFRGLKKQTDIDDLIAYLKTF